MLNRFVLTFFITFATPVLCLAQGDGNSKPLAPTIQVLTLNPGTGVPTITWTPPAYNPLYPEPEGYIIYKPSNSNIYEDGQGWIEIDTVSSNTFTFTHQNGSGLEGRLDYTVATLGLTEPSQLAGHHGSIHLTAEYDSCSNKLNISWNQYYGWGNRIEKYDIYLGSSPNWENLNLVGSVAGVQNIYYHPVEPDREFYIYVEAKKRESDLTTRSNLTFVSTRVAQKPSFMYIDSIIAMDQEIKLRYRIDNNTEFRKFAIIRWEQSDSVASIFSAKNLFQFTDPTSILYSDTTDSWAGRSRPFFYKINGYDGCGRLKSVSNLSNSITIRAYTRGFKTTITWDKFYSANQNVVTYRIYRISYQPTINPPELIYEQDNPAENTFIDDLSQFEGQGYIPQFCYYAEAIEQLEGNNNFRVSRSRTICTEITPEITMPNALDPMSTIVVRGVPRNVFVPTISFLSSYKLIIYDRWGGIVYEGVDTGWNGKLSNGDYAKEGAYLYRIEVYTETGRTIAKTGSLTVIYGPMR